MRFVRFIYRLIIRSKLYWIFRILNYKQQTRAEMLAYWTNPPDQANKPVEYTKDVVKSGFLCYIIKKYNIPGPIMELGCNVGRNLNALDLNGYHNLSGIEINPEAIDLMATTYPDTFRKSYIRIGPIETHIKHYWDKTFDLVFTMAVLEHIHQDSYWIFAEIARITNKYLITIESESHFSKRHHPRNYKKVFEETGLTAIEKINCEGVSGLGGYTARVFSKRGIK